ncbi:hypothetical protein [Luteimonas terrae]|uniref:hypothetical protein n=1 Tax=Luteimonas terrae TaxID=1530191 RepID=UPI00286C6884|nr:hypothetical protein [Luteimonas terrae]
MLAICRSFSRRDLPCSLVARPGADPLRRTRYRRWIEATRRVDTLDLDDMIDCVRALTARHPGQALAFMPTAESINRLVLRHRRRFEQAGLAVPLVSEAIYAAVSDKASLLERAASFGLRVPPLLDAAVPAALPLVAKPRCEFAADGRKLYPELIHDAVALEAFLRNADLSQYFFQSYLDGASYYYLAHFGRDGAATFAYQRNLLQQANGKSIIAAELCGCPDVSTRERLTALFQGLGYHGYAMIETMELEGLHYLIEVNPRFWGPWSLADRAGFLPEAFTGYGRPLSGDIAGGRYVWLGGWLADWGHKRRPRIYPAARKLGLGDCLALLACDVHFKRDSLCLSFSEIVGALKSRLFHTSRPIKP